MGLPSPSNSWGVYRANVISRSIRRTGDLCKAGREEGGRVFLAAPFTKTSSATSLLILLPSPSPHQFPPEPISRSLLEIQSLPSSYPLACYSRFSRGRLSGTFHQTYVLCLLELNSTPTNQVCSYDVQLTLFLHILSNHCLGARWLQWHGEQLFYLSNSATTVSFPHFLS